MPSLDNSFSRNRTPDLRTGARDRDSRSSGTGYQKDMKEDIGKWRVRSGRARSRSTCIRDTVSVYKNTSHVVRSLSERKRSCLTINVRTFHTRASRWYVRGDSMACIHAPAEVMLNLSRKATKLSIRKAAFEEICYVGSSLP